MVWSGLLRHLRRSFPWVHFKICLSSKLPSLRLFKLNHRSQINDLCILTNYLHSICLLVFLLFHKILNAYEHFFQVSYFIISCRWHFQLYKLFLKSVWLIAEYFDLAFVILIKFFDFFKIFINFVRLEFTFFFNEV